MMKEILILPTYWNENGTTQFHVVYLKNGEWNKESINFRTSIFHLGGGGTKKIPISRPEILVNSENNAVIAYLLFRDEEKGNRISLAYKNLSLPKAAMDNQGSYK